MSKPNKSENAAAIDEMRPEYDFTGAERGKFYRADAVIVAPVRLEPEVMAYLQARADARGVSLNRIVNDLLKKEIELIEAVR
jgi:predicted HicB family RNase H-like nuclease